MVTNNAIDVGFKCAVYDLGKPYKVCHNCLLSLKLCLAQFQALLLNSIQIQILMEAIQPCHNFSNFYFLSDLELHP